jgi:hypothetical protein
MPSPSHSSRFYHPRNIGWAVHIIKLLVMQSPPFPRYIWQKIKTKQQSNTFVSNKREALWKYEVKGKVSQNTTSFTGVNETTCFGLLGGHHHVCKVLRHYRG